jgi:hypothetical protein
MDLKYRFVIYLAVFVAGILVVLYFALQNRSKRYERGVKLAGTYFINKDRYYLKKKKLYIAYVIGLWVFVVATIISTSYLIARPFYRQKITEEKYARDIILCLDVSTSVDELNARLLGELKDTVTNLSNERFGIVIFNTSPVVLSPLTNDHEYTLEALSNVQKALDYRIKYNSFWWYNFDDEFYYLNEYISSGTLVGNELRGSSLIGDGLAACIRNFSEDEDRTKIIIFCTDNDPYGEELIPVKEAAALCKERNITVYGIGTKEMTTENLVSMREAVEMTGGAFFLEESSGTYESIIDMIESKSENLVPGSTYYVDHDLPTNAFYALLISFTGLLVFAKLLKK